MAAGGSSNATSGNSNFPDEHIIRQVRNYPCLYDPRENDYKDADRKASVWREIANNVGMTGEFVLLLLASPLKMTLAAK